MYLNWNIQFLSLDEERYHEALVDWPMKLLEENNQNISVLILWWWDGLAARNILKYSNVSDITLVDLDPKITELAKHQIDLVYLNQGALLNEKIKIIHWDAFNYFKTTNNKYDFIVADFPDPRDVWTAKLYSREMYMWVNNLLKNQGVFITQASNAFFSNRAFWSIDKTMNDVFWNTIAYHRYLPSFWDWWFVASQKWDLKSIDICDKLWCSVFDKDYKIDKTTVEINTLAHPIIIEYYGEWYKKFNL
jgi:spermidine synthase